MSVVEEKTNETMLMDVATPADRNIKRKQDETIVKYYAELCHKVERLRKTRTTMIPVIAGALGAISLRL